MKNFKKPGPGIFPGILLVILLIGGAFFGNRASAQNIDSQGTEFWLMFNENFDEVGVNLQLFITGATNTSGTVEIPGISFSEDFNVTANVVTTVSIPLAAMPVGIDVIQDLGIHVTALEEVTVYGLNQRPFSSDAFMGLPTDAIGSDYFIMTYENQNSSGLSRSQFGVVATEDNTVVTIIPKGPIGVRPANVPYNVVLNAGQTYQGRTTGPFQDLTGSKITSNKPIGVFGSHVCATVPLNFNFCDHLTEMLPATDTWGQNFVTVPFANRLGGDIFRIMASQDNTDVTINGAFVGTINSGAFLQVVLTSASQITSSKPTLVAQYMQGNTIDGTGFPGDPFMMLVAPFEQFLANYTVSTPATGFVDNYINIVIATGAAGSVILDGANIPASEFTPIGTSGFSGAQIEIDLGSHNLNSPTPFGVFVYGVNTDDSYGYPGGQLFSLVANVSTLEISPENASQSAFLEQCVEATLTDQGGEPVSGVRIDFEVSGVNNLSGFAFTNAQGVATFCYTSEVEGIDEVTALQGELTATSTITWTPAILDCNGEPNGTAFLDNCDICVGGNTGLEPCEADCAGVEGGSSILDECGVCRLPDDPDFNSTCLDCNGEPNGSAIPGSACQTSTGQSGILSENCVCEIGEPGACLNWKYFLSNTPVNSTTSTIYEITFDDVLQRAYLEELISLEYGLHIGYDGSDQLLYIVRSSNGSFRTLDVSAPGGALSPETSLSQSLGGAVAVGIDANGDLFIGSEDDQAIYMIDKSNGDVAFVKNAPVNGGDLAFDENNDLFLVTRANNGQALIINPGGPNELLGSIPNLVTGAAFLENGNGIIKVRDRSRLLVRYPVGTNSFYRLVFNNALFTAGNGDLASGCTPSDQEIIPGNCYATEVVEYVRGTSFNGGAIADNRANPEEALGEPERVDQLVFVSLGYGGSLTLGFDGAVPNLDGPDLEIVETTYNNNSCATYQEWANVYVSVDGEMFHFAKTICRADNFVDISDAGDFPNIYYVKIVNNNLLSNTPDGFDVDGVVAIHNCDDDDLQSRLMNVPMESASLLHTMPNPSTGLSFVELVPAHSEYTTLEVFDMNGRQVASLLNEVVNAGQMYRLQFNGTSLPNGVYVYRMTSDKEVIMSKFIIAR